MSRKTEKVAETILQVVDAECSSLSITEYWEVLGELRADIEIKLAAAREAAKRK